ncbi:ABC transporter ATP-binding protein [Plantactinospora mayteni]|uniref:Peptide ABC transporter ATP-binding protein n=1 Tax=Plantactinospora mayteni TaxID=566021 RepID=A0ABQ4EXX6_9ACTN|nr:ABC transporter ATP-binding protein [Plantactinospora mayteni]GIG99515.1 peptide ABC transporter ATP-binding protein [Plantactinospora mayteni]
MTALLELHGITKTLKGQRTPRTILDGVDLTVESGESVAILGRSGSGKSTLLSLIGLFDRPDGGRYLLGGQDITRLSERRAAALRSAEFGFVFQRFFLLKHLTAAQNVAMALVNGQGWLPRRKRRARTMAALDQVGIAHLAKHRPARLSGGEQQRVAVARALVREPRLLLADEPTGALDTETGNLVIEVMRSATERGCGLILVTHDRDHANKMRRVLRLDDGVLNPATTTPDEAWTPHSAGMQAAPSGAGPTPESAAGVSAPDGADPTREGVPR